MDMVDTTNHCRMRLGLSQLRSHLYNYNLINTLVCEDEMPPIRCMDMDMVDPRQIIAECVLV